MQRTATNAEGGYHERYFLYWEQQEVHGKGWPKWARIEWLRTSWLCSQLRRTAISSCLWQSPKDMQTLLCDKVVFEVRQTDFFSTTTNLWSSNTMDPYLSFTVHYRFYLTMYHILQSEHRPKSCQCAWQPCRVVTRVLQRLIMLHEDMCTVEKVITNVNLSMEVVTRWGC